MTTHDRPARGETSAAGEARDRLAALLPDWTVMDSLDGRGDISAYAYPAQATALADEIEAGRAALVEVARLRAVLADEATVDAVARKITPAAWQHRAIYFGTTEAAGETRREAKRNDARGIARKIIAVLADRIAGAE